MPPTPPIFITPIRKVKLCGRESFGDFFEGGPLAERKRGVGLVSEAVRPLGKRQLRHPFRRKGRTKTFACRDRIVVSNAIHKRIT